MKSKVLSILVLISIFASYSYEVTNEEAFVQSLSNKIELIALGHPECNWGVIKEVSRHNGIVSL